MVCNIEKLQVYCLETHVAVVSFYHKLNLLMFHEVGKERVFSGVDIILSGIEAQNM